MKKNLLKSLLLTLMVLVGGSAWAGDKTVVKYSFDDANSPSLTAASKVNFDYTGVSAITSTKFLNIWSGENNRTGANSIPLNPNNKDLTSKTWTLTYYWAGLVGGNKKDGNIYLKAGDTNLFRIQDAANYEGKMTLTYGESATADITCPNVTKAVRFSDKTKTLYNTNTGWYKFTVTGNPTDGVKLTIAPAAGGDAVVSDVVLSATNVTPTELTLALGSIASYGIDDLFFSYYVEGEVIEDPVVVYSAVDGISRTISATCATEGATLYYSLDNENWTEGTSAVVSESGNVFFKAVKGTSESDVVSFAVVAGEAITLNAPAIVRSDNTTVTITADQANLLLSPTATIKYTYGNEAGEFTGSKALTVAADATITAYAEATGYTTSATSELAVALFPIYVNQIENTPAATKGWSANVFSEDTKTVSERTYAALLLDDAQWGTNVYFQTDGAWGIRASGNWYINSDTQESWILMPSMKKGDIIVIDASYPASSTVNATYSKYAFGTKHAYEVTENGDVELALKKINAATMDYFYGIYAYTAMTEAEIALIQAKDAFQTDITAAKAIDTTGMKGNAELIAAIQAAETALAAADATAESIAAAMAALAKAVAAFNAANFDFASWIANPTFAGTPIDNNICTYAKDMEANNTTYSQMQPINGWNFGVENGDARAGGIYAIGGTPWLGGANYVAPTAGPNAETEGNVLGLVAVWTGTVQYVSDEVVLPAGAYTFKFPVYNSVGGTTKPAKGLFGFIAADKEYLAPANAYTIGQWTNDSVKFTLTEPTTGKFSVGYTMTNAGSSSAPHLFVGGLTLTYVNLAAGAIKDLQAEIAIAEALTGEYEAGKAELAAAIADAKALLNSSDVDAILAGVETLKAAEAAFNKAQAIAANAAKVAGASLENPVDAPFVVNGTFTDNVDGWTCTGGFQNRARANNQAGDFTIPFFENWNGDAKVNKMYQVIENIPNGVYKLKIAAFVNTLADPNESQFVFANNDSVFLTTGSPKFYEVYTNVENNTIEIGLEQTTATANWMGIDNVSLTYYGAEATIAQVKNAGLMKEVAEALAAKQSVKTKAALQAAYDTFAATATDENKAALEAALAPAKVSVNSYKILETGSLPDNSLEGWTCTNTNTFHINTWSTEGNSDGSGMQTPFIENWVARESVLGTGEIYYSLPGLDPGVYQFSALIRAYSEAGNPPTGASLFAGNREKEFATGKNFDYNNMKGIYDTYAMAAEVGEDGIFKFGIKIAEERNFNWMAFKNCKVSYVGGAIDSAAIAELAKTMPEGKLNAEVKAAADSVIAAAKANINLDNYEAAAKAIAAAQASVTAYEKLKSVLDFVAEEAAKTNVYTAAAKEKFDSICAASLKSYNEGTINDADANAFNIGTRAEGLIPELFLSAYTSTVNGTPYINTWSVEGDNDGSNFKVPFYEYWTGDANSLAANTITAKVEGVAPGDYDITAWVRVRIKNGAEAPATGITLQANDGEAVNVAAGDQVGTSQMYLKEFTATGTVAEDGVLKIKFNVAADNNISWLSFKNVKFEKKPFKPEAIEGALYSWESPEGLPGEYGGKISYENGVDNRLNYKNAGYYTICLNGKKANMNDTIAKADASYMLVTLDEALSEGDTIYITAYVNKNASKKASAYILFDNGADVESPVYSDEANIDTLFNGVPTEKSIIVTEAMAGAKSFKMTRGQTGTNLFITKFVIMKKKSEPVEPAKYEYNGYVAIARIAQNNVLGDVTSETQKVTITETEDKAIVAVTFSGFETFPEFTFNANVTGGDSVTYTVAEGSKVNVQQGQMAIEYNLTGNGTQASTEAIPTIALQMFQNPAMTINVVFAATAEEAKAALLKTTGIINIARDAQKNVIYNINGQKVNKAQKGLFIINGKKVVNK